MLEALNSKADANPEETIENVMNGIRGFVADAEQFDDITMLSLKYLGPQNNSRKKTDKNK
jgi:serine phosphatase RsbU (regulator of sigma subunit)